MAVTMRRLALREFRPRVWERRMVRADPTSLHRRRLGQIHEVDSEAEERALRRQACATRGVLLLFAFPASEILSVPVSSAWFNGAARYLPQLDS